MEEKKKKKSFWKILLTVLLLAFVALMVLIPLGLDKVREMIEHKESILSATVEKGSLVINLSGAGTITDEDAVEINVPAGVEVTEYLVEEGQYVTKGTPLAKVDRVTVMDTISTIQTNLDYVTQQMAKLENASSDGRVNALVSGKVLKIYAAPGDSVRELMDRYGCLALLSIDGFLAADFEPASPVTAGEPVTVRYEDGKEARGKIERIYEGTATVMVSDSRGALDETVLLFNGEGSPIGTGTLRAHSEWRAVGYSGTVKSVSTLEGRKVSAGGTLLTLKDTDVQADYNLLAAEHREYEEVMTQLSAIYKDGIVHAPADGCAVGIDDSVIKEVAFTGETPELDWLVSVTENFANIHYKNLGTTEEGPFSTTGTYYIVKDTNKHLVQRGHFDEVLYSRQLITDDESSELLQEVIIINNYEKLKTDTCAVSKDNEGFPAYSFMTCNENNEMIPYENPNVGDIFIFFVLNDGTGIMLYVGHDPNYKPNDNPQNPIILYITVNGQQVQFTKYQIAPVKLMDVTPQEKVSVTMTVDELDILKVSVGQPVTVTVDALPGRSYRGTVTRIDSVENSSGGNAKFTAKVVMDRQPNMIAGMNASCIITIAEYDDILLIPSEALVDDGTRTFVYTGYDEKEEVLINPVDVKTGVSDGIKTQIVSGLEEGQEIRYAYFDTLAIASQLSQLRPPQG